MSKGNVAKILAAYDNRHRALFVPGSVGTGPGARSGNSWAAAFWAGYDGMTRGVRVPTRSMISYDYYLAGKKAARRR